MENAKAVVTLGVFNEWWSTRAKHGADAKETMAVLAKGIDALRTQLRHIDPSLHISDRGIETLPNVCVSGTPDAVTALMNGSWKSIYASMPFPTTLHVVRFGK